MTSVVFLMKSALFLYIPDDVTFLSEYSWWRQLLFWIFLMTSALFLNILDDISFVAVYSWWCQPCFWIFLMTSASFWDMVFVLEHDSSDEDFELLGKEELEERRPASPGLVRMVWGKVTLRGPVFFRGRLFNFREKKVNLFQQNRLYVWNPL